MSEASIDQIFDKVLSGTNYQVVQIAHPWLKVFAQNANNHAALLFRAVLPVELALADGRGFSVETSRNGDDDYVRITSEELGMPQIFIKMVEFVLDRTGAPSSAAASLAALAEAIIELKHFYGRRSGRLSFEEAQGIFAELSLLRIFLDTNKSFRQVISCWKGPFSRDGIGLHDFTFPSGRGIEVKSTHQPPTEIRVSSPEQIQVSDQQLDLVVLPISHELQPSQQSENLRQIVNSCLERLSTDVEAEILFLDAIEKLGLDYEDEFYDRWNFVPSSWRRFRVIDGFPQLDLEEIPTGIVKLSYSIALANIQKFEGEFNELVAKGVEE